MPVRALPGCADRRPHRVTGRTRWRGTGRTALCVPVPRLRRGRCRRCAGPPWAGNERFVKGPRPSTPPRQEATAYLLCVRNIADRRDSNTALGGGQTHRVSVHISPGSAGSFPAETRRGRDALPEVHIHRPWEGLGGAALEQGYGETRFPHTLTRREGLGGLRPPRKNLFSSRRYAAEPHGRLT